MTLDLVRGQRISLEKEANSNLLSVALGFTWDVAVKKKIEGVGFLSSAVAEKEVELDCSCTLFDIDKTPSDVVYYNQLQSREGSTFLVSKNDGKNSEKNSEKNSDDAQIIVDLTKVPENIIALVFTINNYEGESLNKISQLHCRIMNTQTNTEFAHYTFKGADCNNRNAVIMAKLYRHKGEWKLHALGEPCSGGNIGELFSYMSKIL